MVTVRKHKQVSFVKSTLNYWNRRNTYTAGCSGFLSGIRREENSGRLIQAISQRPVIRVWSQGCQQSSRGHAGQWTACVKRAGNEPNRSFVDTLWILTRIAVYIYLTHSEHGSLCLFTEVKLGYKEQSWNSSTDVRETNLQIKRIMNKIIRLTFRKCIVCQTKC